MALTYAAMAVATGDERRAPENGVDDSAIQADARADARERQDRERRAGTPEEREERARSRTRHRDLSDGEAVALAREAFPGFSSRAAFKGFRPAAGESVERYLTPSAARVSDGSGHRGIVESTYPLRGRTPAGDAAPVDLTLEPHGSGFAPASSPVVTRLPGRLSSAISLDLGDGDSLRVRPVATGGADAARLGPGKVLYANTDTDTDTLAAPAPYGVELFTQIRSVDSPELHDFQFDLPAGAELRQSGRGADVVRGEDRLGVVNPPYAWDADNRRVPVELTVAGGRLRLSVQHREADFKYPIMVDPLIENFQHWRTNPSVDWLYWWFDTPTGFSWSREGSWGRGAYLVTTGGTYAHTLSSYARFAAPGDAYVYAAEFNLLRHQPPTGGVMCLSAGIYSGAGHINNYESAVWTDCGSPWDFTYGVCTNGGGGYPNCNEGVGNAPNEARLQYWAYGTTERGPYGVAHMGGALVKISDRHDPSVRHNASVSGWTGDRNLGITARDTGLGLRKIRAWSPTDGAWAGAERNWSCDGSRLARYEGRCSWSDETLGYSTTGLKEGHQTIRATAEDGLPRSASSDMSISLDRTGPKLDVYGDLRESENADTGPEAELFIDTTDGVENGNPADARSGVKSVEVLVDDQRRAYEEQTCAQNCELNLDWTYESWAYTAGRHKITVIAKDQLGNPTTTYWYVNSVPTPGGDETEKIDPLDDGSAPDLGDGIPDFCTPDAESGTYCTTALNLNALDTLASLESPLDPAAPADPPPTDPVDPAPPPTGTPQDLLPGNPGWALSDQRVQNFDDTRYQALGHRKVRLIVPFDAATRAAGDVKYSVYNPDGSKRTITAPQDPGQMNTALDYVRRAVAGGYEVLVSFERSFGDARETETYTKSGKRRKRRIELGLRVLPTIPQWREATTAFRDRMRLETGRPIQYFTAWNEPNQPSQAPSGKHSNVSPATGARYAGKYWRVLKELCGTECTVAAGDFWDGPTLDKNYMQSYIAGLGTDPAPAWAYHAYFAGYDRNSARFRQFLKATKSHSGVDSKVWLTEQGPLYHKEKINWDESRGNDSLKYLLRLPSLSNRVTRFYYYAWTGNLHEGKHDRRAFDSGLLDPADNILRLGYCTYRRKSNPGATNPPC